MSKPISDEAYGRYLLWLLNFKIERHANGDATLRLGTVPGELTETTGFRYYCLNGEVEVTVPSCEIFSNKVYISSEVDIAAENAYEQISDYPYNKQALHHALEAAFKKASETITENTTHTQSPAKE